jgi:predicted site-specific integrase-resolvase
MSVKETVVARWVSSGLLTPMSVLNHAQYFNKDTIDQFIKDHVFTGEASRILNVGVLTVQKWARNGTMVPIAGRGIDGGHRYFFLREEI